MKSTLRAGSDIDFLTVEELREVIEEVMSGFRRPPQTARPVGGFKLDASGNSVRGTAAASVRVFVIPPGLTFRLHRLTLAPDGYNAGAPYTNAGGYAEIRRSGLMQDTISWDPNLNPLGLPQTWTAGTADGILYTNGESVDVFISGGPPSTSMNVRMQGTLEPETSQ